MQTRRPRHNYVEPAKLEEAARALTKLADTQGIRCAVWAGFAMQFYGSDRSTDDVDFIADGQLKNYLVEKPLPCGGVQLKAPNGVMVDWVVRNDEYASLYQAALEHIEPTGEGFNIVSPDYQCALLFSLHRAKDLNDIRFLVVHGLANVHHVASIAAHHLGGRFAKDVLLTRLADMGLKTG